MKVSETMEKLARVNKRLEEEKVDVAALVSYGDQSGFFIFLITYGCNFNISNFSIEEDESEESIYEKAIELSKAIHFSRLKDNIKKIISEGKINNLVLYLDDFKTKVYVNSIAFKGDKISVIDKDGSEYDGDRLYVKQ